MERIQHEIDALTYMGLAHVLNHDRAEAMETLDRLQRIKINLVGRSVRGYKSNGLGRLHLALASMNRRSTF